jgi:hypothetical protein
MKKKHCFITHHTKLAYKRSGVFLLRGKWKKTRGHTLLNEEGKGAKANYVDRVTPPLAHKPTKLFYFLITLES